MSCDHEPFDVPDDAENQEERAGVQLQDTERSLLYCCFCRKLLLPNCRPLLLACLHSCCRQCAVQRAGAATYLAEQRDSVLVRRLLSSATCAVDAPPCGACSSDAGYCTELPAEANPAYERCDACSLNLCYVCREWHDKFNPRHEVIQLGTYESDASSSSSDRRPQCLHYTTSTVAVPRTRAAAAPDVFCVPCERLRCADCRRSCVTKKHELYDIPDRPQHELQAAATEASGLVADARLAFDERLGRLDALDLPGIATKVRQQARDSFKLAEDALARQKNAVLKELQKVRDDAEDLAVQLLQIESQLRPGVELTRSYHSLLLSSTSDDACVLDQKAVVLSRLDSMLRSADDAKELLDKAGAVIKDESLQPPCDFIAKMIERLQVLEQQQQEERQEEHQEERQEEQDTGSPVTVAASASSKKTNVREISNDIAEEQDNASPPPTASVDASHPSAQPTSPQQQQRTDTRDTVITGSVRSEQSPLLPSSSDKNAAFPAASTSSGKAPDRAIGRNSSVTGGRSSPELAVQNAIDEGVLDHGGGFSDLSHQQQTQQQPRKQMQPLQQPQQLQPAQQQQQLAPQQQQRPPLQQQQQPPLQPPQPGQQSQPAQHLPERQAQRGEQPQQTSSSELGVYHATAGRPISSVRVMHDCRDVALAPNGHLLLAALKIGLIELDASGLEVSRWTPPPTDEGQTDTASTVEVLCDSDGDEGSWRAVVGLMDSQSVVLLRRSNNAAGSNGDSTLLPSWMLDGEPIMLRAAPIRLSVCQPGLLAVAGAQMSVTQEPQMHGSKSKSQGSRKTDRGGSGLVVRRSWSPGPYLDAMQLADGQSRVCETLGYCIQGLAVTPHIVAALSNDTQRTDDGRQRYVIDAFCLTTGRRLWRHGMDSEPSDLCASCHPQHSTGAADVVLYAALQHADRVVAIRALNGADAGELLSEKGNGVHAPLRIALAQIGLHTTVVVLTARREVLLYPVT